MPKISVVIPSYNHSSYITNTLESLEAQTFRDFDVVIVDDGSTDRSVEIIRGFAEGSRLEITLIEQINAGAHAAIERAIAAARGDHVAILNSDDLFHPQRLEVMMKFVPRAGPYIAFSGFDFIDSSGRLIPDDPHNHWYQAMLAEHSEMPGLGFTLLRGNISISTSNFMFSRAMHHLVGPFKPYRTAHDLDFLLRCIVHVEPVYLAERLLKYRLHSSNTITANRALELQEVRSIVQTYSRAVASMAPANDRAPGSRQLSGYSHYFLTKREHWFGLCSSPADVAELSDALTIVSTSPDATALGLEVKRLAGELEAERRELDRLRAISSERVEAASLAANALQAVLHSNSWKLTKPLRTLIKIARHAYAKRR